MWRSEKQENPERGEFFPSPLFFAQAGPDRDRGTFCVPPGWGDVVDLLRVQRKIVPDVLEVMERRYDIIRNVQLLEPVGRRALARYMDLSERQLRGELEFLGRIGVLECNAAGAFLTSEGLALLLELQGCIQGWREWSDLGAELENKLGLERVIVVPGDSDGEPLVKMEVARAAAGQLLKRLESRPQVVAVSGGTTMAQVARNIPWRPRYSRLLVVPARGGLGEELDLQANTIAAAMARKLGGRHRFLHLPDSLSAEAAAAMGQEPSVKGVLELIHSAGILLFSIGIAEVMAYRRGLAPKEIEMLRERQAVGETFGYYFKPDGEVVYITPSVGITVADLRRVPDLIAVAGGKSKAAALLAVLSPLSRGTLVTDQGAAEKMVEYLDEGGDVTGLVQEG